jgi:outer membrane protein assembly factor BamA
LASTAKANVAREAKKPPFGPLRVDYAYPISKASYDVTQRVHFGFGGL